MKRMPRYGLLIADLLDSYQRSIWREIRDRTEALGVSLLTFVGGGFEFPEPAHLSRNPIYELITSHNVDILLLMSGPLSVYTGIEGLRTFLSSFKGIPAVSIATQIPGIPSVIVDNSHGMKRIVDHLIDVHGCKKIAFIKGPDPNEEARMRFEAYKQSLCEHNIAYDPALVYNGSFVPQDGLKAVKEFIDKRKVSFDALVGVDDDSVIEAAGLLKERGFKIPEDVKIAGFDDIIKSKYCSPSLTTVSQPLYELGAVSCDIAHNLALNREVSLVTKIKTHTIIRESCGCSVNDFFEDVIDHKNVTQNESSLNILYNEGSIVDELLMAVKRKHDLDKTDNEGFEILKYLEELCHAAYKSYLYEDKKVLRETVDRVISYIYNKGISISFWLTLINDVIKELYKLTGDNEKRHFFEILWLNTMNSILQVESKFRAFEAIKVKELSVRLQRLGDWIVTCFNLDELNALLRTQVIPLLNVDCCFFTRFRNDKSESQVIFYYNDEDQNSFEGVRFQSQNLFPDSAGALINKSFVILPLICEREELGYICIEMLKSNDEVYDFFAEKIARSIKGMQLMGKINNHTVELELEVAKRTKELQEANDKLREQSFKDQLSGLWNRRFLMDIIFLEANKLMSTFQLKTNRVNLRSSTDHSLGILLIDLDRFKSINDTYGHNSGDLVLIQFANVLRHCVRENDYVVRMGGEEFLVILKGVNVETLSVNAEKIRKTVEDTPFTIDNAKTIYVTCSIGSILFPVSLQYPHELDFMSAITLADQGLYYAKNHGRNKSVQIVVKESMFEDTEVNKNRLMESLDEGVEEGHITIMDSNVYIH